jgi:multimeric flavodoxin WrbA
MNIVVINGTPVKGITYNLKELFLSCLRNGNRVTEFYPENLPQFCVGCKTCFFRGEDKCPHADKTGPVWNAMLEADLIVFAYPVYALRAPASIKSLLDHLCVHWMVHRPDPKIFEKTAVIITNSIGASNSAAQKDVKTSLTWMGISRIYTFGIGMMGEIEWDKMSEKRSKIIHRKISSLAGKAVNIRPVNRKSLKVAIRFAMCKMIHKGLLKNEKEPSLDNMHYIMHGWIKPKTVNK